MPHQSSRFRPARWLRHRHAQTLWPALFRRHRALPWRAEPLELPDGDVLQLQHGPDRTGPIVLLLHGLGGSSASGYINGLGHSLACAGMQPVVMHYRGVGLPNRLDRFYHAGAAEDVAAVVEDLRRRQPERPLAVVGFSLGASMLLNWLAWAGDAAPADAAVAVSVPFELGACADSLERGFGRIYQWDLVRGLKRLVARKYRGRAVPALIPQPLRRLSTLRQFDDAVTAPLHGFEGAADYYRRCSCRQRLHQIRIPTLILHAADDPFVPATAVPGPAELGPWVTLELSAGGGHVGFRDRDGYWLDRRVPQWLGQQLQALPTTAPDGPVAGRAKPLTPQPHQGSASPSRPPVKS